MSGKPLGIAIQLRGLGVWRHRLPAGPAWAPPPPLSALRFMTQRMNSLVSVPPSTTNCPYFASTKSKKERLREDLPEVV